MEADLSTEQPLNTADDFGKVYAQLHNQWLS